ncbi:hypothetical protein ACIBF1_35425 [Spirillospora sp. NPDC050679]
MEQRLTLKLTLPQVNQILDALGKLPYAEVYELIGDLQRQARTQLEPAPVRNMASDGEESA